MINPYINYLSKVLSMSFFQVSENSLMNCSISLKSTNSSIEQKEIKEKSRFCRKYSELTVIPKIKSHNYGSSISKSNSIPGHCGAHPSMNFTAYDILPEDLASQLTLLDLNVFKKIKPEELSSCAWNKKNKLLVAPNVVSFTKRFNQTSFWTVQEILNLQTPKKRSEILAHFIKVAKKLYDLNNLHSLFAIVSGLQSASIYRLDKTWAFLSKKDKSTFDKLSEVFNDSNNWKNLRDHLNQINLPCIPYLGLFLTDIVYIDMAHPISKNSDNYQRIIKMNTVLTIVDTFQASKYPEILSLSYVEKYLCNVRYIEELQKFLEDDYYKLSVKLEPNSRMQPMDGSEESLTDVVTGVAALSLSPARGCTGSLRLHAASAATKFVPGHRKCRSLGANTLEKSADLTYLTNRHLLDDSVLEESHPTIQVTNFDHHSSSNCSTTAVGEESALLSTGRPSILLYGSDNSIQPSCTMQGTLKKKVVLRDGRRPAVSTWQRYWIQIWAPSIVYFPPKCFKGNQRKDFRREPQKMVSILGWIVESFGETDRLDTFLLANPKNGNVYKFRAPSSELSNQWLKELRITVRGSSNKKPVPINLMSFE